MLLHSGCSCMSSYLTYFPGWMYKTQLHSRLLVPLCHALHAEYSNLPFMHLFSWIKKILHNNLIVSTQQNIVTCNFYLLFHLSLSTPPWRPTTCWKCLIQPYSTYCWCVALERPRAWWHRSHNQSAEQKGLHNIINPKSGLSWNSSTLVWRSVWTKLRMLTVRQLQSDSKRLTGGLERRVNFQLGLETTQSFINLSYSSPDMTLQLLLPRH